MFKFSGMSLSLAAFVLCLSSMTSVMADSNDEYYYNSLYRDGEGYNDKNVRNLDGIENQLDTWRILGYPQTMFRKRQLDSIGGGSLLKKRFPNQKFVENPHKNYQIFDREFLGKLHHQEIDPNILEDILNVDQDSLGTLTGKRQMDSIGGGSLLKRSIFGDKNVLKHKFEQNLPQKSTNFDYNFEFSTQKRQIDSIGGGSLLKRDSLDDKNELNPKFGEEFLRKLILPQKVPEIILNEKRQMDSIGGGSLLKRSYSDFRSGVEPKFSEFPSKKLTNFDDLSGFLTEKRQIDSIGGGSLLKRNSPNFST
ncbi:uncharacterized protein LOC111046352 isoform X1 [Nilaparvata lugens]|uniref:uncharacterized protein LOC111046352 isoform X1 n=1 Tax=Nilaparvata lugens TaxID=108931 RepID=UPI00193DE6F7|nr:uncharacterized protein LOC111046352 isoform X1 [Nilaparvata lugens]